MRLAVQGLLLVRPLGFECLDECDFLGICDAACRRHAEIAHENRILAILRCPAGAFPVVRRRLLIEPPSVQRVLAPFAPVVLEPRVVRLSWFPHLLSSCMKLRLSQGISPTSQRRRVCLAREVRIRIVSPISVGVVEATRRDPVRCAPARGAGESPDSHGRSTMTVSPEWASGAVGSAREWHS